MSNSTINIKNNWLHMFESVVEERNQKWIENRGFKMIYFRLRRFILFNSAVNEISYYVHFVNQTQRIDIAKSILVHTCHLNYFWIKRGILYYKHVPVTGVYQNWPRYLKWSDGGTAVSMVHPNKKVFQFSLYIEFLASRVDDSC